jgi:hypothetical protein
MYEEEGCLQAPQLDDDMEAMNPCDPLLTSAMMERDRDIHYLQPACNIESHRELLKRAEAAELWCQALEASLLLEKQVAEQQADALQTAIQQVQTAEVQFLSPLCRLHVFLCLISQMPSHHCRFFLIAQHQRISLLSETASVHEGWLRCADMALCRIGLMSWQWSWRQPATAQSACSWRMQLCRTGWLHLRAICRMHSVRCSNPLPPITQPCSVQRRIYLHHPVGHRADHRSTRSSHRGPHGDKYAAGTAPVSQAGWGSISLGPVTITPSLFQGCLCSWVLRLSRLHWASSAAKAAMHPCSSRLQRATSGSASSNMGVCCR